MSLLKRLWSSRAFVGLGVILFMALLCGWSFGMGRGNHGPLVFGLGTALLSPLMVWSAYEVLRLRDCGWMVWFYLAIGYLLCLLPPLLPMALWGWTVGDKRLLAYTIFGSLISILLVWCWSTLLHRGLNWNEWWNLLRGKSFTSLAISVVLFWNIVLAMVIHSCWHWLAIVFLCSTMNDSFAYLIGRWGKAKLSRHSPNKTKLGFYGGLIPTFLVLFLFFLLIPAPFRDTLFSNKKNLWLPCLLLVPGVMVAPLGDLYFSMHKRLFRIKNYSQLLGSHGGFWDRFDSHCFSLMFWFLCFLIWQLPQIV